MSGMVIAFPANRTSAYCSAAIKDSRLRSRRRQPKLKAQVDRITALLEELEGMSSHSNEVPLAMLIRGRTSIRKLEETLGRHGVGHSASPALVEDEGDPQPDVDREVLKPLFDSLDPHQ